MTQQMKVLATEPEDLSSTPSAHVVEGTRPLSRSLTSIRAWARQPSPINK